MADGDPSEPPSSWAVGEGEGSEAASLRVGTNGIRWYCTIHGQVALWMQQKAQCVYFEATFRVKLDDDLQYHVACSRGCECEREKVW